MKQTIDLNPNAKPRYRIIWNKGVAFFHPRTFTGILQAKEFCFLAGYYPHRTSLDGLAIYHPDFLMSL